ncbi:MAG: nucleotidyl transferase AbiEii/AbiGii toxin family protein [Verrucomicrobiota bacterium]
MPQPTSLPDWEQVLSAAARLQQLLPEAVLVGGTASAIHARHRFSRDADHVLPGLREHYDEILAQLESVAGWKTARIQRPVQILGNLDGIETGIRQLIREQPLETTVVNYGEQTITLPTKEEILRIKGALILKRNATRDYLDFVALAEQLGAEKIAEALRNFDRLYPQRNDESALQQLQIQLANPLPYDLEETRLTEYKNLSKKWQNWQTVKDACTRCATTVFDRIAALEQKKRDEAE